MKFLKLPQKYRDLAHKIWLRVKQPISFVVSIMTKKFTPAAVSIGLAFLLIEKTYSKLSEYLKLVLEKEVAIAASSVVLTGFALLLITIITYTIINWSVAYVAKFFKTQIAEIKMMWQASKLPPVGQSKHITSTESLGNVEKIKMIDYGDAIEMISSSHYGIENKRKAINAGRLQETGGYMEEQHYGLSFLKGGTMKVRVKTTEEKAEDSKARMLYDLIFQEFIGNNTYAKTTVMVAKIDLLNFLRTKELELQNQVFNQFKPLQS